MYRELQRRIPRRLRWSCVAATVVEYGSGAGIMLSAFALVAAGLSRDDSAIAVWTVVLAGFLLAAQTGGQLSRRFQLLLQERSAAAVDDEILGVLSSQSSLSVVRDPELRDLLAILKRGRTALAMLPVVVTLVLSLAVRLLLTSAIVVSVSPVLAIVVATGLAYVYVTFRGRRMTAAMRQAMAAPTRDTERIVDVLVDPKAAVEVRSFELLPAAFDTVAGLTAQTRRELHRSHAKVAVLHGGAAGLFAVVLAAGLAFSRESGLSAPHLVLVALLGRQLSRQVMALVSALSPMAEGITQLRHLAKFRSYTRSRPAASAPLPAPPWDLSVQNVSLRYGEGPDVVRDVSLSLGTGRMVALVGPNGSGKSTLLMGMLGLVPARAGRFLLQGTDVNLVDDHLRSGIGAAFQAPYPFELAVADLVSLGRDASREQVRAALARSGALAFVDSLPAAEQAFLGGSLGGPSVSAGQLQRIVNARCFLPNRWLLVLDEPGAALDWNAERDLVRTLRDVASDGPRAAVLIVTHRLSLAREADEIIVLSDGGIAERGSHDELMESAGLYRGMFETQARTYGVASPEPEVTMRRVQEGPTEFVPELAWGRR